MNNPVLPILIRTRALLPDEHAWTQGASAKDACGHWVPVADPRAVCHCLAGAVFLAVWERGHSGLEHGRLDCAARLALLETLGYLDQGALTAWNDERGRQFAEVADLLDRTIARLAQ